MISSSRYACFIIRYMTDIFPLPKGYTASGFTQWQNSQTLLTQSFGCRVIFSRIFLMVTFCWSWCFRQRYTKRTKHQCRRSLSDCVATKSHEITRACNRLHSQLPHCVQKVGRLDLSLSERYQDLCEKVGR